MKLQFCVCDATVGSQENLWNLWGSVVNDWDTLSKKKSLQIKVSNSHV